MKEVRIITFNCHGLKSSKIDIVKLCEDSDIIFLQELWLSNDEICLLRNIHPDFDGMGVSGMDDSSGINTGRPYGGVAILIRKSLLQFSKFCTYDDKRLISVEVFEGDERMLFLNLYMPFQCEENYDTYLDYLGKAASILAAAPTSKFALIGDFNASVNSKFENELISFCEQSNLIISDYDILGRESGSFTYVSDAHATTSWLDHIICSHDMHRQVSNLQILDKLPCSDHLPLVAEFSVPLTSAASIKSSNKQAGNQQSRSVCNWSKANQASLDAYQEYSRKALAGIDLPSVLSCNDPTCKSKEHNMQLDSFYSDICSALENSSRKYISTCKANHSRDYIVPGFNHYVKGLHAEARRAYVIWRELGRERCGPTWEHMRRTRLQFKYALRQCQRYEDQVRADAMATSLKSGDVVSFWKRVKQVNNKAVPLATIVDGCTGDDDIANMWHDHYAALLNSVTSTDTKIKVLNQMQSSPYLSECKITPIQVAESIKLLKRRKACGIDGLAAEHFIYADKNISVYLSLLFTSCLIHGHLPESFMKSAIVPLIKNKSGDSSDKSNYRPIALVTPCSKLFELVVLEVIDTHLSTTHNQFGFKSGHSTDMCIYTLKTVVQSYRDFDSPVYACFLDASKAFDRVEHWSLFYKLIERNVPLIVVRILIFWYQEQLTCVKWGNSNSAFFNVSNGVRQGGILSPRLFSIYIDDLSKQLTKCYAGCYIGDTCINHVFYADDICLITPSPSGLQRLLDICAMYGTEHNILFNPTKSVTMVFKSKKNKRTCPPVRLGCADLMYVSSAKYLGYLFTECFSDDDDMARQMRLLYTRTNVLLRNFALCSDSVKHQLFKSYCPVFYCPFLWTAFKGQSFHKIRVAFNNVHRKLLNYKRGDSASQMFVFHNFMNFESLLRKCIYSFKQRLSYSTNILIKALNDSWSVANSDISLMWNRLLYHTCMSC